MLYIPDYLSIVKYTNDFRMPFLPVALLGVSDMCKPPSQALQPLFSECPEYCIPVIGLCHADLLLEGRQHHLF